jgi:hypothetical protein
MEKVVLFCIHLKNITAVWYILWALGNLVAIWLISPRFGILCQEKSGNPVLKWVHIQKGVVTVHIVSSV